MAHTPTPWELKVYLKGERLYIPTSRHITGIAPDGRKVQVCTIKGDGPEKPFDAALIFEAPALLAMVEELVETYWGEGDSDPHNPPDIIVRAKRLLKRAKGETK